MAKCEKCGRVFSDDVLEGGKYCPACNENRDHGIKKWIKGSTAAAAVATILWKFGSWLLKKKEE